MKFYLPKQYGFCKGVDNAVKLANSLASCGEVYCLGSLVHNATVIDQLKAKGVIFVDYVDDVPNGSKVIIRAHGVSPDVYQKCRDKDLEVFDATCPYVALIQQRAKQYFEKGYQIVLVGNRLHPEIVGINGWCNNQAIICSGDEKVDLNAYEKVLILFQTTFDSKKVEKSLQNLSTECVKTLEIFNTICYTTIDRQNYAHLASKLADLVVIVGDKSSSNTNKLFDVAKSYKKDILWVDSVNACNIDLSKYKKVSFISGASTPKELIEGVLERMCEIAKENVEVVNVESTAAKKDFMAEAVEKIGGKHRVGQKVKGTVVLIDENGVWVTLPYAKANAFVPNDQLCLDGDYVSAKANMKDGDVLECLVTSTDKGVVLSKKAIDERYKDDALVEGIKNGEQFEITVARMGKECLIGRLGSYTVIVHASQIKLGFVKNLEPYVGKKLRLVASPDKIDDAKRLIFASQKAILLAEKQAKEDAFWNNIEVNEIVEGKVLRFAPFGAFVSVRDFDCLAHTSDLSWDKVSGPDAVLEIGKTYEFVVLALDREKNRVSLGYKQLQPKPWEIAAEKFAVGNVVTGKVARIMPFGAFIELGHNIDGLLHISNVSWEWLDDINKALKVGDEIEVVVAEFDGENKRITLSRKALLQKPEDVVAPATEETAE
ncbi:MAG: 4-hydroxy-3-methylbut-2-enyl diphosphate reductase [Clostridia bacterium]|nr:4-hydroxy-3-methylbut-2-enyl diphosphate reductase [Clostridia bacterium]